MKTDKILLAIIVLVFVTTVAILVPRYLAQEGEPASATREPGPVSLVVLGVEGLEMSIVERLVGEGRLPNIARLMTEGAVAEFDNLGKEVDQRIVWTSLVTGMTPENQGIGGTKTSLRGETVNAPLTSRSRTAETVWTILSGSGATVGVVGWPGTWPVEELNGIMIGPYTPYILGRTRGEDPATLLSPLSVQPLIDRLMVEEHSVKRRDLGRFVNLDSELGYEALAGENYVALRVALAGDLSATRVVGWLTHDRGIENVLVFLPGLNTVSQRFWHYKDSTVIEALGAEGDYARRLDELVEALGVVIERYYEHVDEIVGETIAIAGETGTIALVTDHGYAGLEVDPSGRPLMGHEMHSERGFLMLKGPRVVGGARGDVSLFDAAPTIMAASGVVVPEGLDGAVRGELLEN